MTKKRSDMPVAGRGGFGAWLLASTVTLLGGCAIDQPAAPVHAPPSPAESRALIARLMPANVADRAGWATDIYAAMTTLEIPATPDYICAIVAVTDQESNFRVDPTVPGLSAIAWKEIDRQRERVGIPKLIVHGALLLPSPNGKSYSERIDTVKSEKQLSDVFEDFIGMVPMGKTFFANRNPVRTGGPMQVSVEFAETHARSKPYPYPVNGSIRNEVFSRRGGMYFGIAHLFDYAAPYESHIYRYADFNAGHYASRNAAFQNALSVITGIPLAPDGDLLRYEGGRPAAEPGTTELAARTLGRRLNMSPAEVRRDLELGKAQEFEQSRLYGRVFALADKASGERLPRAVVPRILLKSPKITRKLTTEWFARRVDTRYRACLGRSDNL
ncbi:MAG: DUF1615 domain-containing protein [Burkholderiales bacterium]